LKKKFSAKGNIMDFMATEADRRAIKQMKEHNNSIDRQCDESFSACVAKFNLEKARFRGESNSAFVDQMFSTFNPFTCGDEYRQCFVKDSCYWNYDRRMRALKRTA
jgi:hypothetical protein